MVISFGDMYIVVSCLASLFGVAHVGQRAMSESGGQEEDSECSQPSPQPRELALPSPQWPELNIHPKHSP